METPKFLRRVWALINLASVLAWILSLGIGGILSSVLANLIALDQPWRWLFFVSVLLVGTALTMPLARVSLTWLGAALGRLPPPKSDPSMARRASHETDPEARREQAAANARTRELEAALRSAILELEADLRRAQRFLEVALEGGHFWPWGALAFSAWPVHRTLLGAHAIAERAYRLCSAADDEIDRANAVARHRTDDYNEIPQTEVELVPDDDPPLHAALDAVEAAETELRRILTELSSSLASKRGD